MKMKSVVLEQVDNFNKSVMKKRTMKFGLRCECGADIRYSSKYCWWCGGTFYNAFPIRTGDFNEKR